MEQPPQLEAPAQPNSNGTVVHQEQAPTPQLLPNNGFSYTKFNTALNAGLLNPMSPPPPPLLDSPKPVIPSSSTTRSSPTLFEMMANEQDPGGVPRPQATTATPFPPTQHHHYTNNKNSHHPHQHPPPSSSLTLQERQLLLQERVAEIMGTCCSNSSPQNQHHQNHDVRLTLTSKDGLSVTMNVDRHVLVGSSRFFASKLSDHWSRQQRSLPHLVEISDCDDVEVYVETLRLMYSSDPRRRLLREDVPKVLAILKVCSAIAFEEGVVACLEYLEAAPWAEEEEEKVAELLSQLHLESSGGAVGEVLKRVVSADPLPPDDNSSGNNEETLMRLLHVVLEGKDEKARRDMKGLVSKMLRESNTTTGGSNKSNAGNDLSKDSLYSAFHNCLDHLRRRVVEAASGELSHSAQIARQADNMHWLLDILIDRQLAEDVLLTWAGQTQLADLHRRVPAIHRYEVSRVTARLFVGVGKGQVLVPKEARWLLLKTWLEPFYEDFGWMRRACKGLDRYSVEDGLASTVLTLPLPMQQEVFLAWFDRFLNSGDEYCPNLQKGFEVWWRRAFWKRRGNGGGGGGDGAEQLRLAMSSQ